MPDVFVSDPKKKRKTKKRRGSSMAQKASKNTSHERYSYGPLACFMYYPKKADFIAADAEEHVILILRKHFITNVGWIITAALMSLAPFVLSFFPLLDSFPERFQIIAIVIWYLITTAFVFEQFLSWFFDVNIITDERIFDVDFVNLIYREITDANIDQVQDVTVRLGGVAKTFFNYGDLLIQTAAEVPQIDFVSIPQPDRVAQILRELRVEEEQEKLEGRVR